MKKFLMTMPLALVMVSCGGEADEALNENISSAEDMEAATVSFADGGAVDGQSYFSGLVAEVVAVDVKLKEIDKLDEADGTAEEINTVIDTALYQIEHARKALNVYKDKDWPQRKEFHELTLEWMSTVEMLFTDHISGLAEPMSRPYDTWSDKENDAYDAYAEAYELYIDVDNRWVDFQYVYASANNFEIGGTIDEEAIANEELGE